MRRSRVHHQVRVDRVLAGPADVVWDHVVGRSWLGFDDPPAAGDRVRLPDPFGPAGPRTARVLQVRHGQRLVLEWWPTGRPDDRSEVVIAVAEQQDGTRVTVEERQLPTTDTVARAGAIGQVLDRIADHVRSACLAPA